MSTDVETDGPTPGNYSMLSLGCAAFLPDKTLLDTFELNLEALPQAKTDPETMDWWSRQPEALAAWSDGPPRRHTPLADAIEQGALVCNIRRKAEERARRRK